MKKVLSIVLAAVMLLCLTSCFSSGGNDGVQTIRSSGSTLTMEFPKTWKTQKLNDEASIEMALASKEQYLVVLEESREHFAEGFTLNGYITLVKESMEPAVEGAQSTAIRDVQVGTLNAKQFDISGSVSGIKVTYLVTCFEANNIFYQVVAWSLQSKYTEAKAAFNTILGSVAFASS